MPSQPNLERKGLVVVGTRLILRHWRHDSAFRQNGHEPPRPVAGVDNINFLRNNFV